MNPLPLEEIIGRDDSSAECVVLLICVAGCRQQILGLNLLEDAKTVNPIHVTNKTNFGVVTITVLDDLVGTQSL